MHEHQLVVLAGPGRNVPGRIATLLLPLDIEIAGMAFTQSPNAAGWLVSLTVRTDVPNGLELLIKRLNRLIEVHRVIHLDPTAHRRQSVYVTLRPQSADLEHVRLLRRWFSAETLEFNSDGMVLHLNATPERCEAFVSMLRSYRIVEVTSSAISGVRAGTSAAFGPRPRHRSASVTPLVSTLTEEKAL